MNISPVLLPFYLFQDTAKVLLTPFGGLPLIIDTLSSHETVLGHSETSSHSSATGKYREADYAESFVLVFASGGDCADDFEILGQNMRGWR